MTVAQGGTISGSGGSKTTVVQGSKIVGGGGGDSSSLIVGGNAKTNGISWGPVNIKGGVILGGYTIEVFGSGTIGSIFVLPGRYAKRLGDASDSLYRQDLNADPMISPWQVYANGQWIQSILKPTLG
jgi:hypothetical protein